MYLTLCLIHLQNINNNLLHLNRGSKRIKLRRFYNQCDKCKQSFDSSSQIGIQEKFSRGSQQQIKFSSSRLTFWVSNYFLKKSHYYVKRNR